MLEEEPLSPDAEAPPPATLVVDTREADLWCELEAMCHAAGVVARRSLLSVGDIVIRVANRGGGGLSDAFCLERKRDDDCVSSVRDGRYHDQKRRMLEAFGARRMGYVVEGRHPSWCIHDQGREVQGVVFNTAIRDGISVWLSRGVVDTCRYVLAIHDRVSRMHDDLPPLPPTVLPATEAGGGGDDDTPPHVSSSMASGSLPSTRYKCHADAIVQKVHRQAVAGGGALHTSHDVFVAQLSVVPGISRATATAIAKVAPTFAALKSLARPGAGLEDVRVGGGGKRRLGPKRAAQLAQLIAFGGECD